MPRSPAFLVAIASLALAFPAYAKPVSPELMHRLAAFAATSDAEEKRLSCLMDGKFDLSINDHHSRFEVSARIEGTGGEPKITVLKYTEDGVDKTAEGQKKAREFILDRERQNNNGANDDLQMPVLAGVQDQYVFDEVDRSPDGTHVKIQFTPKHPSKKTVEGSAWVDDATGSVLSTSFGVSKTPIFIQWMHVAMEFFARTPLGPAPSKVAVDAEAAILFVHVRIHAEAVLSGYTDAP